VSSKNNNSTSVSRLLIGQQPHACQSEALLQAEAKNRCKRQQHKTKHWNIFSRYNALHTRSPCPWYYRYWNFLSLAEFGYSDRNGGILCKKRKNSAKIGMVGSYAYVNVCKCARYAFLHILYICIWAVRDYIF